MYVIDSHQEPVKLNVTVADTLLSRFKGLLGTKCLKKGDALLLRPCSSVHTIGMNYPIDIVYFDRDGRAIEIVSSLPPWQCSVNSYAFQVLELASGEAQRLGISKGATLHSVGEI